MLGHQHMLSDVDQQFLLQKLQAGHSPLAHISGQLCPAAYQGDGSATRNQSVQWE